MALCSSLPNVNLCLPSLAVGNISATGVPSPVLNNNLLSFLVDLPCIYYRSLLRPHKITKHWQGKLVWSGHTIVVGQRTCPNDWHPSEVLLGCALQDQFILLQNTLKHAQELVLLHVLEAWYTGRLIQYHPRVITHMHSSSLMNHCTCTSGGSTLVPLLPWSLLLLLLLLLLLFVSLQKSRIFALVMCKTRTLYTRMLFFANAASLAGSDVEEKRILCCLVKRKTCETWDLWVTVVEAGAPIVNCKRKTQLLSWLSFRGPFPVSTILFSCLFIPSVILLPQTSASLTHKNPQRRKNNVWYASRRMQRSIDRSEDVFAEYPVCVISVAVG